MTRTEADISQPADETPVPQHVAIVMDGNGRWARERRLPRIEGHRRGVGTAQDVVRAAHDLGIRYLTLFAFSAENWKRPAEEVSELMTILRHYLAREVSELHRNNVRLGFIGAWRELDADIVALMEQAAALTRYNSDMYLTIAVNYGGQQEIVTAAQRFAEDVKEGRREPSELSTSLFSDYLDTAGLPEPDLVIRTSGEQRLSNFLLWQSAYAEFVFADTFWPDFTPECLGEAVNEFRRRDRTYGAVPTDKTLQS